METVKDRKGQVAVEFIMMFVLCVSVIIYIFYFCYSLASLEYKTYVQYMVGRTITASSKKYDEKKGRADAIIAQFNVMPSHYAATRVTSPLMCQDLDPTNGYRGILDYGTAGINYDVVSNVGVACSLSMPYVLPSIISGRGANALNVAIESMTGSEISDEHCKCALGLENNWKNCVDENISGSYYIDNGC